MKRTLEEKLRLVHLHIDEGVPIHEICNKYKMDPASFKHYCALYRRWGEQAFNKSLIRDYTRQMKLEAIHDVLTNHISYNNDSAFVIYYLCS